MQWRPTAVICALSVVSALLFLLHCSHWRRCSSCIRCTPSPAPALTRSAQNTHHNCEWPENTHGILQKQELSPVLGATWASRVRASRAPSSAPRASRFELLLLLLLLEDEKEGRKASLVSHLTLLPKSRTRTNRVTRSGELRITVEQNPEHEPKPSDTVQQQVPRDTQSGVQALNTNTEPASSGTRMDRSGSTIAENGGSSHISFTFTIWSLDALMLWAAVYIMQIAGLALEMDAALRHISHSSASAFTFLLSFLMFGVRRPSKYLYVYTVLLMTDESTAQAITILQAKQWVGKIEVTSYWLNSHVALPTTVL